MQLIAFIISSPLYGSTNRPVLVDFTHPKVAYKHTRTAIAYGVHPVIGTTGITSDQTPNLNGIEPSCGERLSAISNLPIILNLVTTAP